MPKTPTARRMRSFAGCQTCRTRKLKCDQGRPGCRNCAKGRRDCDYNRRSIFRHFPDCLRNSTWRSAIENDQLAREYAFPEDQVWTDVPAVLRWIEIDDPYMEGDTETPPTQSNGADAIQSNGVGAVQSNDIPAIPNNGVYAAQGNGVEDAEETGLSGEEYAGGNESIAPFGPTLTLELPDPPSLAVQGLVAQDDYDDYSESPRSVEEEEDEGTRQIVEILLTRHYEKGPGSWMDLFDTESSFFSRSVPIIGSNKPILKSAMCALAAIHLRNLCTRQDDASTLRKWPILGHAIDWAFQSAKKYDEAIGHLKRAVEGRVYEHSLAERENILAAVAILCVYELMDGRLWRAHLSALPLVADSDSVSASPPVIPRPKIHGSIFWSLARQDLLGSCIFETQTRLDVQDMKLWQNEVPTSVNIEEDAKSNELTVLLGEISNYLTSGDAINPNDYALPLGQRSPFGVTQDLLLQRWNLLTGQLRQWHDNLPGTFACTQRTQYPDEARGLEQVWYELPICAATMQNYHMANILLLTNKPQESTAIRSSLSARLASYRHTLSEVPKHAREICGISLANPTDAVRVNSVQPLFVAGQVFACVEPEKRPVVLDLLDGIQKDLQWPTAGHIKRLGHEWSLNDRQYFS